MNTRTYDAVPLRRCAFLGLGVMGHPMARHLVRAGHAVTVYNRTASKAQVLEVIGKGAAQSWQMDNRGKTMLEDRFDFSFAVDWMRKDLGLVLAEARLGHVQPRPAPEVSRQPARGSRRSAGCG